MKAGIPTIHLTYATPIGYQPFMRCASQSGFMIEAREPYNMYRDISFQKVKFRHTEEICNWIYQEMQEGDIKKTLFRRGYTLSSEIAWCTPERMQQLEHNWANNAASAPQLQGTPRFRPEFCI